MPAVADQYHVAPRASITNDFHVNLGHQRTGRIEHGKAALFRFFLDRARYAMRAENHGRAIRHFGEFFNEHRAHVLQPVNDKAVMHDLVAHIDRRTELDDRLLDDLDRPIDAGTEPPGVC